MRSNSSSSSMGGTGTDGKVYASYGVCADGKVGVSSVVKIASGADAAVRSRKDCVELEMPDKIELSRLHFATADSAVFALDDQVYDQQSNAPVQKVTLEFCQSSGATPAVQSLIWQLSGSASLFGSVTTAAGLGTGSLNLTAPAGTSYPLDFVTATGQSSQFDLHLDSAAGGSLTYTLAGSSPATAPNMVCQTQPMPGFYPNASNTGVPTGTTLTNSSDITVTVDGTVIDSMLITGCVHIQANNVTIKNSKILAGTCNEGIKFGDPNVNLVVQDTEIDGQNTLQCGLAIGYSNYTLLRVNIHGCTDGPRLSGSGNITIQDSYIHDLNDDGSTDGMQAYGLNLASGKVVKIIHNTIEGGSASAISLADGVTGDIIIDSNLLMGPKNPLRLADMHVYVRNNLVYDNSGQYYSPYYGPVFTWYGAGSDPGVTISEWTNNHLTSTRDGSVVGAIFTP